jgi:hypothetical protein
MGGSGLKIFTSYFYQVRFFQKNDIPLSTAMWDPKWYHANKGQNYQFLDKRGVLNGLRAEPFVPGISCDGLCHGSTMCISDPHICGFLREYSRQLQSLDINDIIARMEVLAKRVQQVNGYIGEPHICLLFHEAPNNPCSERVPVQKWFQDNGIPICEWKKPETSKFAKSINF